MITEGCKHQPNDELLEDLNNPITNPVVTPKPPDTICFSSDILPLVIATCSKPGCHNFTNYNQVMQVVRAGKPNSSELYYYAKYGSSEMRTSTQRLTTLDTTSLNKIYKWISQGAVNSICNTCDTVNVKYSTHIKPIIQQNCIGCHNTSGTLLNTYDQVKAKVTDGKLYGTINWLTGFQKMPQNSTSKLADCKLRAIQMWIDAGALNN